MREGVRAKEGPGTVFLWDTTTRQGTSGGQQQELGTETWKFNVRH